MHMRTLIHAHTYMSQDGSVFKTLNFAKGVKYINEIFLEIYKM